MSGITEQIPVTTTNYHVDAGQLDQDFSLYVGLNICLEHKVCLFGISLGDLSSFASVLFIDMEVWFYFNESSFCIGIDKELMVIDSTYYSYGTSALPCNHSELEQRCLSCSDRPGFDPQLTPLQAQRCSSGPIMLYPIETKSIS